MLSWWLLVACGSVGTGSGEEAAWHARQAPGTTPGQGSAAALDAGGPGGQANLPPHAPHPCAGMVQAAAVEDLASSWDKALAVAVPALTDARRCPDADQDGATDAWRCPLTGTDCDDHDARVGPENERWVRPGPFLMGSSSEQAGRDEGPVHVVTLSGYCLDRKERVGPDGALVAGVDWAAARAVCEADGKSLPTEAQWEKAARGGCELGSDPARCDVGDLRPYPWGVEAPSCARANHQSSAGAPRMCEGAPTAAVRNTGPYGHDELAGNLWEWTLDRYHPHVYRRSPVRVVPLGPSEGDLPLVRGGGGDTFSTNMRVAHRLSSNLEGTTTGVRCARARARGTYDAVAPLEVAVLSGEVRGGQGPLVGAALYVTVFDAADADPATGIVAPGRSPAAEVRLVPDGARTVPFRIEVPVDGTYVVMGALDGGASIQKNGQWVAQSGAGGMGRAEQNPLRVGKDDIAGIVVTIRTFAGGGPPAGMPGGGGPPHPQAGSTGPGANGGPR